MGLLFSKENTLPTKNITYEKPSIQEIIKRYEFIKQTKEIYDIEVILEIVKNTDWEKKNLECIETPSAPSIPIAIPIN